MSTRSRLPASSTTSTAPPTPRRRQHRRQLDSKLKTEQEPTDSAVLRTAVGGEAGSKLPVGFGERADPVLANAPVESGEPDI